MDIGNKKCPICGSPTKSSEVINESDIFEYDCYRCGKYKIEKNALDVYKERTKTKSRELKKQIALFTGWIRENQNITINNNSINHLYSLKLPTLNHRATNLLKSFTDQYDLIGGINTINFDELERILPIISHGDKLDEFDLAVAYDLKYIAATWSYDIRELEFIYEDYLIKGKKYLTKINQNFCKINPKGWAYLETFRNPNPDSKKAFVAMWFDEEMENIYDEHIEKAIQDAGYKSIQIGRKEHNNDINDEIIGEIRSCKFVVADLTGNRGGVYYEAGFADGLNIPVIYTCREDWWDKEVEKKVEAELEVGKKESVKITEKRKVHFDLNHKNFIKWRDGNELYEKLLNRIKATIV